MKMFFKVYLVGAAACSAIFTAATLRAKSKSKKVGHVDDIHWIEMAPAIAGLSVGWPVMVPVLGITMLVEQVVDPDPNPMSHQRG